MKARALVAQTKPRAVPHGCKAECIRLQGTLNNAVPYKRSPTQVGFLRPVSAVFTYHSSPAPKGGAVEK